MTTTNCKKREWKRGREREGQKDIKNKKFKCWELKKILSFENMNKEIEKLNKTYMKSLLLQRPTDLRSFDLKKD